jgi:membrane protein implicated in regulation of membrane protease activity
MVESVLGDTAVTVFTVIGAVGLLIVLATLVVGELLDGLFGALDIDAGGGVFSAPVIGSFLAAFGFGAALIMTSTRADATLAALGGLASGLVVGGLALVMMRTLMRMPTDETVTTRGLEGTPGVVITAVPAQGYGEVTIRHHGEQRKYNAMADEDLPAGTRVQVTAVLSPSAVVVAPVASPTDTATATPPDA